MYVWHNSLRASVCNYAGGQLRLKNKWKGTNFDTLSSYMMCIDRKIVPINRTRFVVRRVVRKPQVVNKVILSHAKPVKKVLVRRVQIKKKGT